MINFYYSRGGQGGRKVPLGNPLANALVIVVGTLAVAASLVLGFIAFVILGSLVLILAAIIGIRVWWLKRKLARQGSSRRSDAGSRSATRIHVIEGEFRDVSRKRKEGPRT